MTTSTDTPPRATYGTEITSTYVGKLTRRPDFDGEEPWEHHEWTVTLTREGKTISLPFRMGMAHEQTKCGKRKPNSVFTRIVVRPYPTCGHQRCENAGWQPTPPTLYDVLCSLKADCTDGETFRDWARNFGMDTDSIKAREMYFACQESEARSRDFFGSDWATLRDDEAYS